MGRPGPHRPQGAERFLSDSLRRMELAARLNRRDCCRSRALSSIRTCSPSILSSCPIVRHVAVRFSPLRPEPRASRSISLRRPEPLAVRRRSRRLILVVRETWSRTPQETAARGPASVSRSFARTLLPRRAGVPSAVRTDLRASRPKHLQRLPTVLSVDVTDIAPRRTRPLASLLVQALLHRHRGRLSIESASRQGRDLSPWSCRSRAEIGAVPVLDERADPRFFRR